MSFEIGGGDLGEGLILSVDRTGLRSLSAML
jgi:hypothetical protein